MKTSVLPRPTVTALATTLLVTAAPFSHACELCAVYSATAARGELHRGWHASFAEQFTHQGTIQLDSARATSPVAQSMTSSTSQLVLGYNFSERVGLQLNLPMIHRSFERPDDTGAQQRGSLSGLGDLALAVNFLAYQLEQPDRSIRWSVLAGVKLPTGNSSRLQEEVDELTAPPAPVDSAVHGHDLTLGSGSVDGLVGTSLHARLDRWFFNATTQFALRGRGRFGYRFAKDLTWSGGPGAMVIKAEDYTLSLQANVSGETKGQDKFAGGRVGDTGLTAVYVGPQISATWRQNLSAEAGVDLPVSVRNTELQVVPDYRLRLGLTWRF